MAGESRKPGERRSTSEGWMSPCSLAITCEIQVLPPLKTVSSVQVVLKEIMCHITTQPNQIVCKTTRYKSGFYGRGILVFMRKLKCPIEKLEITFLPPNLSRSRRIAVRVKIVIKPCKVSASCETKRNSYENSPEQSQSLCSSISRSSAPS